MTDQTSLQKLDFRVTGMDCAGCALKIETAVSRISGTRNVSVNAMTGKLSLEAAQREPIMAAVLRLGYGIAPVGDATPPSLKNAAQPDDRHDHDHAEPVDMPWWRGEKPMLAAAVASLGAIGWLVARTGLVVELWALLPAVVVGLQYFLRRSWAGIRGGYPFSIETLMTIASAGAVIIGATGEAVAVMTLFLLGETLEAFAGQRARKGIKALMNVMPNKAFLIEQNGTREIEASALKIGDVILVRPGDRVAADGEILEGASSLDESPVTGESMPVNRSGGESVFAGSINVSAALKVRVTSDAADNTIARIIKLVEEAQASKSATARFIDRFSRFYTPWVLVAAAIVAVAPPLLLGADWQTWTYRSLGLLLVACPCALVLSTPAAIASGLAAGTRRGILVKGGAALEMIGKVKTIAFDKTGTLTEGRPQVTDVFACRGSERDLLALAAAVEGSSAHPIAHAIVMKAKADGLTLTKTSGSSAIAGKAVEATVDGKTVTIGSPRYAAEQNWAMGESLATRIESFESEGKTAVLVHDGSAVLGVVAVRDESRAEAADALARIRSLGVSTMVLTGDNARTGSAIAAKLGMEARSELLPQDKLRIIGELKANGGVAMVGDGINDAPALAAADVGIAMGGGTGVALETGDAALLRDNLHGIADLLGLSRATLANIYQNVTISVGLKAAFLVTTLAGITGLWFAILADTGATLLVTLNALRLLAYFANKK